MLERGERSVGNGRKLAIEWVECLICIGGNVHFVGRGDAQFEEGVYAELGAEKVRDS
jgi:hypothetical protein